MKKLNWIKYLTTSVVAVLILVGCSKSESVEENNASDAGQILITEVEPQSLTDIVANESASDGKIDFTAIKGMNEDTIGWIYVPNTTIDYPILCSTEELDYYEHHDFDRVNSEEGAVHTQLYNNLDFSDCFTIIYGYSSEDGNNGYFSDLYKFTDDMFFSMNDEMYVYTEKGVLIYEIISAYERDKVNVMSEYDTTDIEDCNRYLSDEFLNKRIGGNYRQGWEGVNGTNYFLILTTSLGSNSDHEYVLTAVLKEDPAKQVNRIIY